MKKKLLLNTVTSLLLQLTTLVCGFILPRMILGAFGSEVNGLVSSINQFLSLITFLELGVGSVIQSALYKPLAEKDDNKISEIVVSGGRFFNKIGTILLGYVIVLAIVYPLVVKKSFDWSFVALLIIVLSISSFAQYYFGIVDRLLLTADQSGYIQYISQIITLMLNTLACAVLIKIGASIHIVKLTSSLLFLLRPLVLHLYVNSHYNVNRKIILNREPIKQKWNGIAQHIAAIILSDTDVIILTLFASLTDVSVYYVYMTVLKGIEGIINALTSGAKAAIGELWARHNTQKLTSFLGLLEFGIHTLTTFIFSCTAVLLIPFVSVYTLGIEDANYIQPLFAVFLVLAYACLSLRLPYLIMILAGGHYKQTQNCFIIAATLNLTISIVAVFIWGLIGVAIGTFIAMLYQTLWMSHYVRKKMVQLPFECFLKQCFVDVVSVLLILLATSWINLKEVTYLSWIIMGLKVGTISLGIMLIINFVFFKDKFKLLLMFFRKKSK